MATVMTTPVNPIKYGLSGKEKQVANNLQQRYSIIVHFKIERLTMYVMES